MPIVLLPRRMQRSAALIEMAGDSCSVRGRSTLAVLLKRRGRTWCLRTSAPGQGYDQSCPWVGLTHGLGWVGLGWVGLGRDFSVFGGLGWGGSTIAKVQKI